MTNARLVPELYVSDFDESRRFYTDVLGFTILYSRPEERFAYLDMVLKAVPDVAKILRQDGLPKAPPSAPAAPEPPEA